MIYHIPYTYNKQLFSHEQNKIVFLSMKNKNRGFDVIGFVTLVITVDTWCKFHVSWVLFQELRVQKKLITVKNKFFLTYFLSSLKTLGIHIIKLST